VTDCWSIQANVLTDGGKYACKSDPSSCAYTWAVQGIVQVVDGSEVVDSTLQVCNAGNDYTANCPIDLTTYPNIDAAGWVTQEEFFLTSSSQLKNSLTVEEPSGTVFYTDTVTCNVPAGSITYMDQMEGVIVGIGGSSPHASFSPLNSEIFYGYIDLVSNYNKLSSQSNQNEISDETSNLYPTVTETVNEAYGSMYLYSVMWNQNTESGT